MRDGGYFSKLREFLSNERRGRTRSLSKRRRVKRASPFRIEQLEARVLLAGDLASVTLQAAVVQEQYVEGAVNLQNGVPRIRDIATGYGRISGPRPTPVRRRRSPSCGSMKTGWNWGRPIRDMTTSRPRARGVSAIG
jgi:hypothetical protein